MAINEIQSLRKIGDKFMGIYDVYGIYMEVTFCPNSEIIILSKQEINEIDCYNIHVYIIEHIRNTDKDKRRLEKVKKSNTKKITSMRLGDEYITSFKITFT